MITPPTFLDGTTPHCGPTTAPLFDSNHPDDEARARALCAACPLRQACATHALTAPEPDGTWGGLTAGERLRILNPDDGTWLDRTGRVRLPCGTFPALGAHYRYGETCGTCEAAQEARTTARRRRRLAEEHTAGGTPTGAAIHRRLGEEVCVHCRAAVARQSRTRRQHASRDGAQPMAMAS